MTSMGLVTAFGMPGFLELGIIALLVLPVIVALVFFVLLSQKTKKMNSEVASVPDDGHSWHTSRWLMELLRLAGIIGVCFLAWLLFT